MAVEPTFQKSFVLTVAESKRLIAKGVARHPAILRALASGIVAVAKGTTNSYIVEELTGEGIHKPHFVTGHTLPAGRAPSVDIADKLPDLVLRHGERIEGVAATEIIEEFGPGDVFMKGANALNYDKAQAGILIGHPTGGTIGAVIGTVVARRAHLFIPVGLEKNVPGDLYENHMRMTRAGRHGSGPTLWPIMGEIFTELEALQSICGVAAAPIGAGGVAGAEGSVRIAVWGRQDEVDQVQALLEAIRGEPLFAET